MFSKVCPTILEITLLHREEKIFHVVILLADYDERLLISANHEPLTFGVAYDREDSDDKKSGKNEGGAKLNGESP